MASRKIEDVEPKLREAYEKACKEWDEKYPDYPKPFITCSFRSNEEQSELYNRPWDKKDNDGDGLVDERDEKVTNAKAGQSKHNVYPSKAIDIAFKNKEGKLVWAGDQFVKFAVLIKKHGVKWGGDFKSFKDQPHFEI